MKSKEASMDTFKEKDGMMAQAMKNAKEGMTTCETTKGESKNYGHVDTEYGSKPVPNK